LAFFGLVIPLCVGIYQRHKRLAWDKAMLSYELQKAWTEKTSPHRAVIEKKYGSYLQNVQPVSIKNVEGFARATQGDNLYPLRDAVVSLLNYFEDIAVLYSSGMVDKKMVDLTIKDPIISYYEKIKPLADCIEKVSGKKHWQPLENQIYEWNFEKKKSVPKIPKRA
jgi:hypothetical protein